MSSAVADTGLSGKVRSGLAWSALNSIALRAGTFAMGIVLARLLVPEQFGVYAVALAVQGILMTLADLGLSADLIRAERPEERAATVGFLGLASGGVLAAAMALTAAPVASLMGSPESAPVIVVLSVTLVLAGAGVVPFATLQRQFDQRKLFAIGAVDLAISTVLTIALLLGGMGVLALAVARVVAQSVSLVLQFVMSHTRPRYRIDRRIVRSVIQFGVPIAIANLLSWALLSIDTVVVSRMAGPVALGFYVLAFNVSTWPMTAVGQVVRSLALPTFSEIRRGSGSDGGMEVGAALTWAAAAPAGAALAVLAPPLVEALYGDRWAAAAPVLTALAVFGALRVMFDLMASYLYARGESATVLVVQVLWFVALLPAIVIGTSRWGIEGAAWSHLIVAVVVPLPAYLVVLRRAGVDIAQVGRGCIWPSCAVVPAAAAGVVASQLTAFPPFALLLGLAAGGVVYVALVGRWVRRLIARAGGPVAGQDLGLHGFERAAKVSVVIPCYNYGSHLPAAVGSVLCQEGVDVEVIVVDDASTDDSVQVAEALASRDRRVRLLRHDQNQGPVATFNDGLAAATGEFLVRLDADDVLTPGSLARSAAVCRQFPGVGLVYGRPIHFDRDPPPMRRPSPSCTVWSGRKWLEDRCSTGVNVITSPEAFLRMSVVLRVGGQRQLAHTHDMEMWMRVASVSDVAYIRGADQAWHREHPGSLSLQADDELGLTILRERRAAFDVLFAEPVPDAAVDSQLATLARRTLAVEALGRAAYEYDRGRAPARDVAPLVGFALETDPTVRSTSEWRALDARTMAGERWATNRPWLLLRPVRRVARDSRRRRRWNRTGLYNHLEPLHHVPVSNDTLIGSS